MGPVAEHGSCRDDGTVIVRRVAVAAVTTTGAELRNTVLPAGVVAKFVPSIVAVIPGVHVAGDVPVIAGTTRLLTRSDTLSRFPSLSARMNTEPGVTPVTMPPDVTVARLAAALDHVIARPVSSRPRKSNVFAVSVADSPCFTLGLR
jgi:hypothetical protein